MTPTDPIQVRFAGAGGQGVMLAGVLLAEAGMLDGRHVVSTQSYGPEARLGAAKSEVVLSEHEIVLPEVRRPDIVVCLSPEAYRKHGQTLAPGGVRIVDERVVGEGEGPLPGTVVLPLVATARGLGPGGELSTNVVALGALVALTGAVTEASLRRALGNRIKPKQLDLNERALVAGLSLTEHHPAAREQRVLPGSRG
jgi:2-oxoglutarate ferredoxin oxidoreductase subunit gamma